MGRTLDQYKQLLDPLRRVTDHLTSIPANESMWVRAEPFYRVVYFLEGDLIGVSSDGERFEIRKGDALLVGPSLGLSYTGLVPEKEVKIHILKVEMREVRKEASPSQDMTAAPLKGDDFLQEVRSWMKGIRLLPEALNKFGSLELIKQIKIELEQGEKLSPWRISGLCIALISPLFESPHQEKESSKPLKPHRGEASVEHACQHIQQYAHHKLNLGAIAWQVQLSGEHLGRLFRKYRGITVMDYVKQVRMEKVKHLLETTSLPVVDIAKKTGYSTPSLLCRHFKEATDMTPLAYRLRAHKRENFFPSDFSAGES
ncbi:helix-turn-helix transcriptional regulator [Kiritimatiellota bacterium B12222]|nr:helix-turn-helix transcriptional regulator [Kiritimatiellota bacterium B12222]